jgi:hypothetical protein
MWRYGFDTPTDYDDNNGNCGGFWTQWGANDGKCGLCGDAWDAAVREHEAPDGKYATGTIARSYGPGETIAVAVELTANHWGSLETTRSSFTFRLCPAPGPLEDPSQDCMDLHVLRTSAGGEEWEVPSPDTGIFNLEVELPAGLECERCVLQWTYRAGNNWGTCEDGSGAVGCGKQEHFRACADIRIGGGEGTSGSPTSTTSNTATTTSNTATTTSNTVTTAHTEATTTPTDGTTSTSSSSCHASGPYTGQPGMDEWCERNCRHPTHPYCPPTHCTCL